MRDLNAAEAMVLTQTSVALEQTPDRTEQSIRRMVEGYAAVAALTQPGLSIDVPEVTARLLHTVSVLIPLPKVLKSDRVKPWWAQRKPELAPMSFWLRYRRYLHQQ